MAGSDIRFMSTSGLPLFLSGCGVDGLKKGLLSEIPSTGNLSSEVVVAKILNFLYHTRPTYIKFILLLLLVIFSEVTQYFQLTLSTELILKTSENIYYQGR